MTQKTVAALTSLEISHFRKELKSRRYTLSEHTRHRLEKARFTAARAAALLRKEFSVVRVVVFGSIVSLDLFHDRSDIDLAVWGLEPSAYYRAVGILQSIDPEFSIDLIIFDEASDGLKEAILNEGVDL